MAAITWKLGRLKLAEHLLREAARHLPRPLKREVDVFLTGGHSDGLMDVGELPDDLELSRLEIAKLQKRAEDWEQKDVVAFEKTIADLREKLTETGAAHQSELAGAYTERNVAVDRAEKAERGKLAAARKVGLDALEGLGKTIVRAEKAERELESYAATDLTASLALVDVTRERDEARERLAAAETLAEQRRVELKVHKQFTKQYNAAVERERDEARADLENYRGKAQPRLQPRPPGTARVAEKATEREEKQNDDR